MKQRACALRKSGVDGMMHTSGIDRCVPNIAKMKSTFFEVFQEKNNVSHILGVQAVIVCDDKTCALKKIEKFTKRHHYAHH